MEALTGSVVCTMSTYMLGFYGERIARNALEFGLDGYLHTAYLCPL